MGNKEDSPKDNPKVGLVLNHSKADLDMVAVKKPIIKIHEPIKELA
jgi:hypothetical protein